MSNMLGRLGVTMAKRRFTQLASSQVKNNSLIQKAMDFMKTEQVNLFKVKEGLYEARLNETGLGDKVKVEVFAGACDEPAVLSITFKDACYEEKIPGMWLKNWNIVKSKK